MKKALNVFFVTLGVIFFIIILIGLYLFVVDPLNLKPLLFGNNDVGTTVDMDSNVSTGFNPTPTTTGVVTEDKNPALNSGQEEALEKIGIDPATLPSQITPAQEACFVSVLGQARVDEIKAGDTPSVTEFFRAKGCLE